MAANPWVGTVSIKGVIDMSSLAKGDAPISSGFTASVTNGGSAGEAERLLSVAVSLGAGATTTLDFTALSATGETPAAAATWNVQEITGIWFEADSGNGSTVTVEPAAANPITTYHAAAGQWVVSAGGHMGAFNVSHTVSAGALGLLITNNDGGAVATGTLLVLARTA